MAGTGLRDNKGKRKKAKGKSKKKCYSGGEVVDAIAESSLHRAAVSLIPERFSPQAPSTLLQDSSANGLCPSLNPSLRTLVPAICPGPS
jgi:hypothetical protein